MKLGLTLQINCLLMLKQTSEERKELLDNAFNFLAVSELHFSEAFSFVVGLPCPKGGPSSIIYCSVLTLVFQQDKEAEELKNNNKLVLAGSRVLKLGENFHKLYRKVGKTRKKYISLERKFRPTLIHVNKSEPKDY